MLDEQDFGFCENCGDETDVTALTSNEGVCDTCLHEALFEAEAEDAWEREMDPDSEGYLIDGVGFADPGGNSALRAATRDNPRNLPCPTCGAPNRLTPIDRAHGYQCDSCADRAEGRGWDY